jgi:hypothetical protein
LGIWAYLSKQINPVLRRKLLIFSTVINAVLSLAPIILIFGGLLIMGPL